MVGTKRTKKVTAPRNDDRCRQKKQQLVTVAHVYTSVRRQLLAPGYWLVETSDRLHAVKQEEEYDDDGFKVGFSSIDHECAITRMLARNASSIYIGLGRHAPRGWSVKAS